MSKRSNDDRLALIAHYVIARTRPHELGATRLNKILWFADCLAYERFGQSLTGLTRYRRLDQGPVPDGLDNVLDRLAGGGVIAQRTTPTPGHARKEFFSLQEPATGRLNGEEVDLLHQVIDFVCARSAREISELSHDALWHETPHLGWMSVAGGSVRLGEVDADQIAWAEQELHRTGVPA